MIVHTVRQPFLCREGQFSEGKRELCIGLDYHAIKSTKTFWCYLGNNRKVVYEIDSAKAIEIGQQWNNPAQKLVLIVPLSIATIIKSEFNQIDYDRKEEARAKINQKRTEELKLF